MLHFFHSVLYGLNILRIDITCRVTLNNFQHVIQEPFSLLLLPDSFQEIRTSPSRGRGTI